ncbi:FimV/HubP family polar landmark protein [Thiotrichales bacterium HSG1]|nr:FimV/HubP family polar landmark protein [Thiotrichales bacterium HSG1]
MRTITLIIFLIITNLASANAYGPTKAGDLLWNIAGKIRSNTSITRYQAMLALLKANPHAFQIPCNLNTLKINKILQIPTNMQELTSREAVNEFYRQRNEWQNFRSQGKRINCNSVEEQLASNTIPALESVLEPKAKITPIKTTIIPKVISKPDDVEMLSIAQVLAVSDEPDKIKMENPTLIQSIWNDVVTWFYDISYLHRIIFLTLITLFSISLILLIFASIFRGKKSVDKLDTTEIIPPEETIDDDLTELPEKNDKMREKLDTVRAYLAEDEISRIQRLLREVMQNGTDEQRTEAQQLYEINKKMSYLKLNDTQAINTNLKNIEQINKLMPVELSATEDKEQVFSVIDKVFMMLDEELNGQGKLIDSYIARQQEVTDSHVATSYENDYQVVEEPLKRPDLKPTRKL